MALTLSSPLSGVLQVGNQYDTIMENIRVVCKVRSFYSSDIRCIAFLNASNREMRGVIHVAIMVEEKISRDFIVRMVLLARIRNTSDKVFRKRFLACRKIEFSAYRKVVRPVDRRIAMQLLRGNVVVIDSILNYNRSAWNALCEREDVDFVTKVGICTSEQSWSRRD